MFNRQKELTSQSINHRLGMFMRPSRAPECGVTFQLSCVELDKMEVLTFSGQQKSGIIRSKLMAPFGKLTRGCSHPN